MSLRKQFFLVSHAHSAHHDFDLTKYLYFFRRTNWKSKTKTSHEICSFARFFATVFADNMYFFIRLFFFVRWEF